MILSKGLVRLGTAFGLSAMLLGLSAAFATSTYAQNPPATFYGTAEAGDEITATIDGEECASATAGADGFWQLQVPEGGDCGASDGDTVGFTLNGTAAEETETWQAGGAPSNVAEGVTLTPGEEGPTPPATGNGGFLVNDATSSPVLALALGLAALATLAGARMATRNR
jgi:hypothetical protein